MASVAVSAMAVAAFTLVMIVTRQGPGVSSDSVFYLVGAHNLASGRGYVDWLGNPITLFGGGLSLTAVPFTVAGHDPSASIRVLNSIAFAALVVLAFAVSRRYVSASSAVVVAALTCVAPSLVFNSSYIWAEPIFCALIAGQLLVLDALAVRRHNATRLLVLAGLIAGVAFSYRYAGVVVIAFSGVVIAATCREEGVRRAVGRAGTFLAVALVIPAVVAARNCHLGVGPLGARRPSAETAWHVIATLVNGIGSWVLPATRLPVARAAAVIVMAGLVVFAGLRALRTGQVRQGPVIPAAFVAAYLVFLICSEFLTKVDPINGRLLSPAFVPAAVTAAWAVEALLRSWSGVPVLRACAATLVVGIIALDGVVAVHTSRTFGERGAGLASMEWRSSPIVQAIRQLPEGARIYSNRAADAYYSSGRPVHWASELLESPLPGYLVSFNNAAPMTAALDRDDLTFETVERFDNGYIARIVVNSG